MATLVRRGAKSSDDTVGSAAYRKYIRSQIYMQGYTNGVQAGSNSLEKPTALGGEARWLYGITLFLPQANVANDDTVNMTINNEQILQTVLWRTLCPQYNLKLDQFFSIPRPLSGADTVQMVWNAAGSYNVYAVFYLSNTPPKSYLEQQQK